MTLIDIEYVYIYIYIISAQQKKTAIDSISNF